MTLNLTPITPGTLTLTGTASGSIAIGPVFTVTDGSTDVAQPGTLKFSGATVTESPAGTALVTVSGGSQPGAVRLVDLGSFDTTLRGTPVAYDTQAGETVLAVLISEPDGDGHGEIVFGDDAMLAQIVTEEDGKFGLADVHDPTSATDSFSNAQARSPKLLLPTTSVLKAGFYIGGVFAPAAAWQANHLYAAGAAVIVDADQGEGIGVKPTVYVTEAGGTSGGTEPAEWTINPVDVVDGTVTWHDTDYISGDTPSCSAQALVAAALS